MMGCAILDSGIAARKNGKRLPCEVLEDENARLRQELAIRESSEQEKVIDYLGKECVDWEDKYRALAKENAKLRELAAQALQIIKHVNVVMAIDWARYSAVMSMARELGVEVPS